MQGNRYRDTKPELALRSALHRLGLRYRVSIRPAPEIAARADIVFMRARVAVFVDGCFWHGSPDHFKVPELNQQYWSAKITRNRRRDSEVSAALREAGWVVLRIWEHEVPETVARTVAKNLRPVNETPPGCVPPA